MTEEANTRQSIFSSIRERRLWTWTAVVVVGIYATLSLARTLSEVLRNRGLLDSTFVIGFLLILGMIVVQAFRMQAGRLEIGIGVGVLAVYLLLFARMGIPEERTHLIEYSVVAVLVLEALIERSGQGRRVPGPALLAIVITTLIGLVDELIQLVLPNRVFDPVDVLFNTLAAVMAVGASVGIRWARSRSRAPS